MFTTNNDPMIFNDESLNARRMENYKPETVEFISEAGRTGEE